jgi:CheY-like chemotaxis protein
LVDEADSKSAAADPASRFESGEGHWGVGLMKVLLAEDDPGVREGLAELVQDQAQPIEAGSLEEALDRLATHRFDLVLTDLMLDGVRDAGWQIAQEARNRLIPVVLVSGAPREHRQPPCRVQGVLEKPFDVAVVLRLLDEFGALQQKVQADGAETIELPAGAGLPVPQKGGGVMMRVSSGRLVSQELALTEGEFGFLAPGEPTRWRAETAVRLTTVPLRRA